MNAESRPAGGILRRTEVRLLLPVLVLVPLGYVLAHVGQVGLAETGPLAVPLVYLGFVLGAHLVLRGFGHRGDPFLLPIVAAMGGIGLIMLSRLPQELAGLDALGLGMAPTQLLWFGVGLTVMVGVAVGLRDDGFLRHYKYSWGLFGAVLLTATLVIGTEVNGARLWIYIGPIGFQPSELIKMVLAIFLAGYLAETRAVLSQAYLKIGPLKVPPLPYLLPMLVIFGFVMAVVVVSRDLGTALLFFGVFLTMLFVATGRRSYVLFGFLLFFAGAVLAYFLFGHVRVRVDAWLNPWADPADGGYQIIQALYAFARGGVFGEGLGQGIPLLRGHTPVPAMHNDFIFAAVGEDLGFIGASAVLALAALLVFRGLRVAIGATDDFRALLAVGLTVSLGLQVLIITAGNLKLIPLTGVTFPFLSYGGSSLLVSFAIVGVLLAISHRSAGGGRP